MPEPRIGGTFAPPLTDNLLASYRDMVEGMDPSSERYAIEILLACVDQWWQLPEPEGAQKSPHPSGTGVITALSAEHSNKIDRYIPYTYELEAMQRLFDGIPAEQHDMRNAAFHLLWHVKELDLGREPLTKDKL